MLTEQDKKWLRQEIKKAVEEVLTVEMTWQKVKDEKTGQPLAAPELLKEYVFLPSFFVQHIKFHEGAFRGMQEDINKSNNRSSDVLNKIDILGQTFVSMQEMVEMNTRFMLAIRESGLLKQIEQMGMIEPELITNDS